MQFCSVRIVCLNQPVSRRCRVVFVFFFFKFSLWMVTKKAVNSFVHHMPLKLLQNFCFQ